MCLQVRLLAKHTGHSEEKISKDIARPRYFDPYQAVDYSIIDRVRGAGLGPPTAGHLTAATDHSIKGADSAQRCRAHS